METRKKFSRIKPNVWMLEEDGEKFSVKRYTDPFEARKIREVHERLEMASYPFTVPVTKKGNDLIVVQPWLENAQSVDFSKQADRRASIVALEALHATQTVVKWEDVTFLRRYPLLDKWEMRLERFQNNLPIIENYLQKDAIQLIEWYSEQALNRLQTASAREVPHTILHGDVVHHNLLKTEEGTVFLIDFDLACVGNPDIEIGLWLHRVLPNVGYNAAGLFSEEPRLQVLGPQAIAMMQYPNELLREWSYLATLPLAQQHSMANHLNSFTERALQSWDELCYFSNTLLEDDPTYP
ncbi:phosphotransferase [Sporosarcina aquimarina]|uniref:phosphotransferase n=1 Tax=Sporosarcina aquimarina TaxID=114975 RepID=UPI00295E8597|nr:phosphotransferase [Sporosarcina aquimarina]